MNPRPPLSVRLLFAAGFRVPREHEEWALRKIRSPGWPIRQMVARLWIICPAIFVGLTIGNLFISGPADLSAIFRKILVFTPIWVLFASVLGGGWPELVRRRAISRQIPGGTDDERSS